MFCFAPGSGHNVLFRAWLYVQRPISRLVLRITLGFGRGSANNVRVPPGGIVDTRFQG